MEAVKLGLKKGSWGCIVVACEAGGYGLSRAAGCRMEGSHFPFDRESISELTKTC